MRYRLLDEWPWFGWVLALGSLAGCVASAAPPGSSGPQSRSRAAARSLSHKESGGRSGLSETARAGAGRDLEGSPSRRNATSTLQPSGGGEGSNGGPAWSQVGPLAKAGALLRAGRLEEAAGILDGLVQGGLGDERAFAAAKMLGRLRISQRRYDEARKVAGLMEKARPGDPAGPLLTSRVEELLGHAGRAMRAAQRAVRVADRDPVALRRLAETLLAYGKPARAADAARRALAILPGSSWTLVVLGDALWATRRYAEAAEVYRKAASANLDGRGFQAQALDRLGTLYQKRRKVAQARAVLARCTKEFPRLGCPFTEAGFMRPDPTRPERRETYAIPRGQKRRMQMGGEK